MLRKIYILIALHLFMLHLSYSELETSFHVQKVDHYSKDDDRVWRQRIQTNRRFYKEGGPVLLFVGGEADLPDIILTKSLITDIAKEVNGGIMYVEHRFYGLSGPTEDLSTENLKYLTVKQAIGDLLNITKTLSTPDKPKKIILIGGSYSGTLATWFRRLHPEESVGAWISSAPLLAKTDFYEYRETIGKSLLKYGGQECYDKIKLGFKKLENYIDSNQLNLFKKTINACKDFNTSSQYEVLATFHSLADDFGGLLQEKGQKGIEEACKIMHRNKDEASGVIAVCNYQKGTNLCHEEDEKAAMAIVNNVKYGQTIRPFLYQNCYELGWFPSSNSAHQPFGRKATAEFYLELCARVFGIPREKNIKTVEETNRMYGGLNPEVTNVYFTQGEIDPWRPLGVSRDLNKYSPATVIPGVAHWRDLDEISPKDPEGLRASKERTIKLVKQWIMAKA